MLMIAANLFAQQQMATLNHNDTITVFYGNYALRDAHNAAVNGDIITLSSGSFNACNITKAITLHGAGCDFDTITGMTSTIIIGNYKIDIENDSTYNLTMEGIYNNKIVTCLECYNSNFIRCYFYVFSLDNSSTYVTDHDTKAENLSFINCIVDRFYGGSYNENTYTSINSILRDVSLHIGNSDKYSVLNAYNSVLEATTYSSDFRYSTFHNSICLGISGLVNYMIKCICYKVSYDSSTNMYISKLSDVFETYHELNNFSFDERYILKEEIATSFLGSDGTEVGIHGGMFPFDTRPSYMVVKKCNVANKSTIDGKLSVDIEVMVEE